MKKIGVRIKAFVICLLLFGGMIFWGHADVAHAVSAETEDITIKVTHTNPNGYTGYYGITVQILDENDNPVPDLNIDSIKVYCTGNNGTVTLINYKTDANGCIMATRSAQSIDGTTKVEVVFSGNATYNPKTDDLELFTVSNHEATKIEQRIIDKVVGSDGNITEIFIGLYKDDELFDYSGNFIGNGLDFEHGVAKVSVDSLNKKIRFGDCTIAENDYHVYLCHLSVERFIFDNIPTITCSEENQYTISIEEDMSANSVQYHDLENANMYVLLPNGQKKEITYSFERGVLGSRPWLDTYSFSTTLTAEEASIPGDYYFVIDEYQREEEFYGRTLKYVVLPSKMKINKTHGVISKVDKVNPTYDSVGVKEHYVCEDCGELFEDSEGRVSTTEAELIIPKLVNMEKINTAKTKIPADLSKYTDETVKKLMDLIATIENEIANADQAQVDAYARQLEEAINNLTKKSITYRVIEGADIKHNVSEEKKVAMRINHDFTENVVVEIDGKIVDKSNYTVTEGSTIITFTEEFIKYLEVGTHNVRFIFEDGVATTTMVIETNKKDVVATGDNSPVLTMLALFLLSLAGAGCILKMKN